MDGGKAGLINSILENNSFSIDFFPQLILTNKSWDNPPVYLVTMGLVGPMKLTRKQKLFAIKGFFLQFFYQLISTSGIV